MLGPHHRINAKLGEVRLTPKGSHYALMLFFREPVLGDKVWGDFCFGGLFIKNGYAAQIMQPKLGSYGHFSKQAFKQCAAIRAAQRIFKQALRVRHHAQNVACFIDYSRNVHA